ncbi:MAG: penicillin-binding protein 1C [Saprospiraceae bacterium]
MKKQLKKLSHFLLHQHRRKTLAVIGLFLLWYAFCLPRPLFDAPTSMVLEDRNGQLLGARIATDGQWRFPAPDSLPEQFVQALLEFEDRRFFSHPGVDMLSLLRALIQNVKNGEIVSGGSTLTMQVMRMACGQKRRTIRQKLLEMIMATRLELGYSKEKILQLYATHAPFGGNVVGLETASWRYFGKRPQLLSWAEAAMLAVLPNSPGLIHPSRNRQALLEKRNRLLLRLYERGQIDKLTYELALEEELPDKPHPLPQLAPHLLDRAYAELVVPKKIKQSRVSSSLDAFLQEKITDIVDRHHRILRGNGIHNLAALVIDVPTGEVMAYVGNVANAGEEHGQSVDIITAPRSTGSTLKPILYALALQEGLILPESLIPDIPTRMSGYQPENFHEKFDGAVTARRALVRSLNVPMVRLLQSYGLEKFHYKLKQLGLYSINQPAVHYGLPLVLGGAEASLWETTNVYACMSRMLGNVYRYNGQYDPLDFRPPTYLKTQRPFSTTSLQKEAPRISASAAWFTFEAMQEVERPNSEGEWAHFRSNQHIAWKTGTSFGFRDAWALGVTPRYAVGVWVGNADGEGRPNLIGINTAAPVLFDVFSLLGSIEKEEMEWFRPPYDEMIQIPVCHQSGYRATANCSADTIWVPERGLNVQVCPYHQLLHLDPSGKWQVNSRCEAPDRMQHTPWFILPPLESFYYKKKNPGYQEAPPFRPDCESTQQQTVMQLIYPKYATRIYVPVDLDGQLSRTVFEVAHRQAETIIYWHLDNEYIKSTQHFHNMELNPDEGKHLLTLVDEFGNRLEQRFEVIKKE